MSDNNERVISTEDELAFRMAELEATQAAQRQTVQAAGAVNASIRRLVENVRQHVEEIERVLVR